MNMRQPHVESDTTSPEKRERVSACLPAQFTQRAKTHFVEIKKQNMFSSLLNASTRSIPGKHRQYRARFSARRRRESFNALWSFGTLPSRQTWPQKVSVNTPSTQRACWISKTYERILSLAHQILDELQNLRRGVRFLARWGGKGAKRTLREREKMRTLSPWEYHRSRSCLRT